MDWQDSFLNRIRNQIHLRQVFVNFKPTYHIDIVLDKSTFTERRQVYDAQMETIIENPDIHIDFQLIDMADCLPGTSVDELISSDQKTLYKRTIDEADKK